MRDMKDQAFQLSTHALQFHGLGATHLLNKFVNTSRAHKLVIVTVVHIITK
jgi:hypothetical protein